MQPFRITKVSYDETTREKTFDRLLALALAALVGLAVVIAALLGRGNRAAADVVTAGLIAVGVGKMMKDEYGTNARALGDLTQNDVTPGGAIMPLSQMQVTLLGLAILHQLS